MPQYPSFSSVQFDRAVSDQVIADITQEIYKAGRIPNVPFVRKTVSRLLNRSVSSFSSFIARLDKLVGDHGFPYAAQMGIRELAGGAQAAGAELIPAEGPLIIASNHPGVYDGFVMIANLPRDDFKLVVSGIPFFRNLPNASRRLIFATPDTTDRMETLRQSVHHLQSGGTLIIYPSGRIDPDPAVLPGAQEALSGWSRSIELFMRKVPQAQLVLAITSGVLSKEFIHHPYAHLFRNDHERRRVTEFMQVIKQMVRGKPVDLDPAISFAKFERPSAGESSLDVLGEEVNRQAKRLLAAHISRFHLQMD